MIDESGPAHSATLSRTTTSTERILTYDRKLKVARDIQMSFENRIMTILQRRARRDFSVIASREYQIDLQIVAETTRMNKKKRSCIRERDIVLATGPLHLQTKPNLLELELLSEIEMPPTHPRPTAAPACLKFAHPSSSKVA